MEKEIKKDVVPPVKAEETVTLKKSELDELMERITRVESAADKSRVANYDDKNKKEVSKTVKLRVMDGKVVISWDTMTTNLVEKTPAGVWFEDQKINIHYEDGSEEEMSLVVFNRRFTYLKADVISKTIENSGTETETTIYKVKATNGKEYSIDKKFIN